MTAVFCSISSFAQDSKEPSIIISHTENKTFYEYMINGKLVEIKVVPKVGPTYYLVPTDSDDMARNAQSSLTVPKWVIFSW
jgi:hypothetical protein